MLLISDHGSLGVIPVAQAALLPSLGRHLGSSFFGLIIRPGENADQDTTILPVREPRLVDATGADPADGLWSSAT